MMRLSESTQALIPNFIEMKARADYHPSVLPRLQIGTSKKTVTTRNGDSGSKMQGLCKQRSLIDKASKKI